MTAPAPIVTLIVPGRDIAAYAPAALDSLRAQTEPRWRAILIDDGSTDDTGAIFDAAASADRRFTTIRHEASRGLGAARNVGLARVDTPYLGFLDADDELLPDALARLTGILATSGSDFVAGAYVRSRLQGDGYVAGRVQPWVAAATSPEQLGTTLDAHPRAVSNIVVRWRLRAEGTSITQSKAQLPVLRDYLTALRGGIRVLTDAGARASVTARLELILAMDVAPLLDIASSHPDPAYAAEVDAFIAELRALPEFADAVPDPAIAAALAW